MSLVSLILMASLGVGTANANDLDKTVVKYEAPKEGFRHLLIDHDLEQDGQVEGTSADEPRYAPTHLYCPLDSSSVSFNYGLVVNGKMKGGEFEPSDSFLVVKGPWEKVRSFKDTDHDGKLDIVCSGKYWNPDSCSGETTNAEQRMYRVASNLDALRCYDIVNRAM
jgi:hypothetical protein